MEIMEIMVTDDVVDIELLNIFEELLLLLDDKYYSDYNLWLNVGIILKNLKLKDGLNIWKRFSSQWKKYNEHDCDGKWESFNDSGALGFASLIYYIKESGNKKELTKILKNKKLKTLLNVRDVGILKLIDEELRP